MRRCSRCGGAIYRDEFGDVRCLMCARPVVSEKDRERVAAVLLHDRAYRVNETWRRRYPATGEVVL